MSKQFKSAPYQKIEAVLEQAYELYLSDCEPNKGELYYEYLSNLFGGIHKLSPQATEETLALLAEKGLELEPFYVPEPYKHVETIQKPPPGAIQQILTFK